ncbi:MAG: protein-tyrosine-phosphatase [Alphaproteobacteria bacterium]|nr:protein-tyrosine-phosphatase [Alphaproteobacteria bacterium]
MIKRGADDKFQVAMRAVLFALGALLAACATASTATPAGAEAGAVNNGPAPVTAVGDLHGDFDAYFSILRNARLIDRNGRWVGKTAKLVQLGDVADRGPDSKRIIDHLMRLQGQATRSGGEVVALIGNHEAMNVSGDLRYVHPGEYAAFVSRRSPAARDAFYSQNEEAFRSFYRQRDPEMTDADVRAAFDEDYPLGYVEHRRAWSPDGAIGRWVVGNDAIRVIGRTLFVHGGVSADVTATPINEINERIQLALRNGAPDELVTGERSPLWFRGYSLGEGAAEADVSAALAAYDVDRIVVAHTPQLSGIATYHGGRVVVVDTGISAFYGGTRSYLRIDGDTLVAVNDGLASELPGIAGVGSGTGSGEAEGVK